MLSSAHVLAMDAKNLLDVVDSVRVRYPHVNSHILRGGVGDADDEDASGSTTASSSGTSSLEKQQHQRRYQLGEGQPAR